MPDKTIDLTDEPPPGEKPEVLERRCQSACFAFAVRVFLDTNSVQVWEAGKSNL